MDRRGKDGGRRIARRRLYHDRARINSGLGQLFGDDKTKIGTGDDGRRCHILPGKPPRRRLKQCFGTGKRGELFREAFARQGPKTRAGSAAQKNGMDGGHRHNPPLSRNVTSRQCVCPGAERQDGNGKVYEPAQRLGVFRTKWPQYGISLQHARSVMQAQSSAARFVGWWTSALTCCLRRTRQHHAVTKSGVGNEAGTDYRSFRPRRILPCKIAA